MYGRVVGWVLAVVAVVVVATLVPTPGLEQMRTWAGHLGPWFTPVFCASYALVTVAPIPRSTFTYSAAVLFPPSVAVPWSLVATGIAAALAFEAVRRLGHEKAATLRADRRVAAVDAASAGLAVGGSLRLVLAVRSRWSTTPRLTSSASTVPARDRDRSAPGTVAALLGNSLTAVTAPRLWATAGFATVVRSGWC